MCICHRFGGLSGHQQVHGVSADVVLGVLVLLLLWASHCVLTLSSSHKQVPESKGSYVIKLVGGDHSWLKGSVIATAAVPFWRQLESL